MKIGEKQVSILDSSLNKYSKWHASMDILHEDIIYIERELVGLSNSGSDIYYQYKLIRNNVDALPLIVNNCQCNAIYSDLWVHRISIRDERNIFHFRDYHPEIKNTDDIIFMPFEKNLGLIQLSYGEEFTIIRMADKNKEEKIILLGNIFTLVDTIREISYCDSWADFLAKQFVNYFDKEITNLLTFYYDYCADWQEHYRKYYYSVTSIDKAEDYMKSSIINRFENLISFYIRLKAKYLNSNYQITNKEIENGFENKIKVYRDILWR